MAIKIKINEPPSEHKNEILIESATSYLNSKNISLKSYNKAYLCLQEQIEGRTNKPRTEDIVSCMRAFLVQARSSIDLLVCLTKAIVDKKFSDYYPDINKTQLKNEGLKQTFKDLKQTDWFIELNRVRNMLVHKGFDVDTFQTTGSNRQRLVTLHLTKRQVSLLRTPKIDKKYIGTPYDTHGITVEASTIENFNLIKIINGYCKELPLFEERISVLLKDIIDWDKLNKTYCFTYNFKDLSLLKI
ncbi:hypothetical protein [Marivirga aurantiaca]|nr:hypothetical protein [Marivirga aurantiaca]